MISFWFFCQGVRNMMHHVRRVMFYAILVKHMIYIAAYMSHRVSASHQEKTSAVTQCYEAPNASQLSVLYNY